MSALLSPYIPVESNSTSVVVDWYSVPLTTEEMNDYANNKFELMIDIPEGSYILYSGITIAKSVTGEKGGDALYYFKDKDISTLIDAPDGDLIGKEFAVVDLTAPYGATVAKETAIKYIASGEYTLRSLLCSGNDANLLPLKTGGEITFVVGVMTFAKRGKVGKL